MLVVLQEKFAKLSASLVGKKKVRSVSWSSSRTEIYVGTQDGTITIWDTKKGQPICKLTVVATLLFAHITNYVDVIKSHGHEITKVQWIESKNMLLTSSKEKIIKVVPLDI